MKYKIGQTAISLYPPFEIVRIVMLNAVLYEDNKIGYGAYFDSKRNSYHVTEENLAPNTKFFRKLYGLER